MDMEQMDSVKWGLQSQNLKKEKNCINQSYLYDKYAHLMGAVWCESIKYGSARGWRGSSADLLSSI